MTPTRFLLRVLLSAKRMTFPAAALVATWQIGEALVPVIAGATFDQALDSGNVALLALWLAVLAADFLVLSLSYRFAAQLSFKHLNERSAVLREQGVKVAARTYRAWRQGRVSTRTVTDAQVVDAVRDAAWSTVTDTEGVQRRKMTPEGLYGRKKMTALIRRTRIADASRGADASRVRWTVRCERSTCRASPERKGSARRSPARDGIRAGDLLNRDFTAPRPDHTWVMDFTYVRSWAGWVYVAFILDVYSQRDVASQRIVAWHAQTTKHGDLVMIPLRMALWERDRQGHSVGPGQLIYHSDAGSQYTSIVLTEHLALEQIAPSIGSVGDAYDCQSVSARSRKDGVVLAGVF